MASPVMVETFTIPLRTKKVKPPTAPQNNNKHEKTGFPFDDSDFGDRDRSFRSHIDDIVQRHPELAEHLNFDRNFDRFPFRSNTWGHKRRGSASTADESKPCGSTQQQQQPESRRFGRPFGSRFEERFGFPFSKTFDGEPEYYQQQKAPPQPQAQPKPQPKPQAPQQEQQPQQQQPQPPPQEPEKKPEPEEKPPQVPNSERGRKQNPNLPQSSTVDLGQKQDPLYDTRGQRSMSAPPENRAGQQRYVSSINIPMSGGDPNAQPQTAPQPQQWQQQPPPPPSQPKAHPTQQSKSTERVIPIHVEGRDEPVIPKRANPAFSQPPPQPERVFPPPQQERVFGQRPAGFGHWDRGDGPYYAGEQFFPGDREQFFGEPQYFDGAPQFFGMNRGEPQQRPDEFYAGPFRQQQKQQQQQPPQPQPQPQQKPQPPPPQQQQPAAPTPAPQQQQTTPPPQQPQPPKGPIDQIHCIQRDVLQLMDQVEKFNGQPKDKQYAYLDEMLTRNLLKLDDIDTEGKENIRLARKEAINCIQRCISILEAKAAANEQIRNQLMDVDAKLENPNAISAEPIPLGSLEVSGVTRSGSEAIPEPEQAESGATPMEVANSVSMDNVEAKVEEAAAAAIPLQMAEPAEAKKPEDEALKEQAPAEVKEGGESEEKKVEDVQGSEQPVGADDAATTSQTSEATKEEVKDKKEKKKVKKKEKSVDKAAEKK